MGDSLDDAVSLLRDVADELENEDVLLMRAEHRPEIGSLTTQRLDIEWQNIERSG